MNSESVQEINACNIDINAVTNKKNAFILGKFAGTIFNCDRYL